MSVLGPLVVSATLLLAPAAAPVQRPTASAVTLYSGMADASAGAPLGDRMFLAFDDESNALRVYRLDRSGPPVHSAAWDSLLGIASSDKHPEADVEGATRRGDRVYWITSHGRNKDGKWRANRHRFFAMTVGLDSQGTPTAKPLGTACRTLIADLVRVRRARDLGLARALGAGIDKAERLAPKEEGLNVEGLAAMPDGKSLLLGFRNPLDKGKAIVVPLGIPDAVLLDQAAPEFGEPIELDLSVRGEGGPRPLGIRSIEYSPRHGAYLLVAGPPSEKKVFALYRWSGGASDKPVLLEKATAALGAIQDFTPEAIIVYPQYAKVQVLSDDGSIRVKVQSAAECREDAFDGGTCEAKELLDSRRKTFKSVWVDVE